MTTLENLLAQIQALYYPPPRHGTLKLSIAAHPELDRYFTMADTLSVKGGSDLAHDAELRLSLSMIDYIIANAQTFDPRDTPYVKAIRAHGEMSLVHHFTQLLKRPTPEVSAIHAGLQHRSYDACQAVAETERIDLDEILDAMRESRPLCLRGALKSPLVELGAEQFVERYGDVVLRQNAVIGRQETVADIARRIRDESVDRVYLNGVEVPPELTPHVQFPMFEDSAYSIGLLWWGKKTSSGVITKLHRDFQISFLAQIWGEKKLHLFSPDQTEELYAAPAFNMYQLCGVDPGAPDLQRYPRFAQARPLEVTIGPGDMLMIPTGWFHCVWALTDVLSVNRFMEEATLAELLEKDAAAAAR
ncbi:cupin-like domain-containing protein [Paraburkholderia sp. D15]|uniref:cupin-like domain-containing protein n=1 Tax=Paraburkholderia sp. D15 TaxID=2880218 RepID=UPI002479E916|nr:cupin-like domain-containing protein [Paraburkholderia sp. D15]WGS52287.1 cupin-like domain-containing protein [Paraburkholderia sp. D15]WKF59429.1 hypothetical protein HUO10_003940 [Paraburkholderia busanensis]